MSRFSPRSLHHYLKSGGLIAYPTESCYGLGCDPRNYRAIKKLLRLKKRLQGKGMILVAANFEQLKPFVAPLKPSERAKIERAWPGPVTWVLPASNRAPQWLKGQQDSVAVRVTAHSGAARLCKVLNMALVSTSANISGRRPIKTHAACVKAFGRKVRMLRGRVGRRKRPSTILDLKTGRTLRK
jgi:L-threonylcarbamoyladenylate synthase